MKNRPKLNNAKLKNSPEVINDSLKLKNYPEQMNRPKKDAQDGLEF